MEIKLLRKTDDGLERCEILGDVTCSGMYRADEDPLVSSCGVDIYRQRVLFNLNRSLYVDSTGIQWLLSMHKRFADNGGQVVFHSITPATRKLLALMRMDRVLHLVADEAAARTFLLGSEKGHENRNATPQTV